MKIGQTLAITLLIVVSTAHLLRAAFGITLVVGEVDIPIWVSVLGCLLPGSIAILLWREGHAANSD